MRKKIKGFGYAVKHDNKNFKKFKKQRETRGFDNTELWNLDTTIARFITPRLKAYIALKDKSIPQSMIPSTDNAAIPGSRFTPYETATDHQVYLNEWRAKLQKMLDYFDFVAKEKETSDRVPIEIAEGLELFCKHYSDLWD